MRFWETRKLEHQLSFKNIISRPLKKTPKSFFVTKLEEQIRCLISEHLFQIAERVKFNENVLLKMYHMANYKIKNVLYLSHV